MSEGGRAELEEAFLHRACGLFLMEGEQMDAYILKDIARLESGGEELSPMCALAFLEYYSRHGDERSEETDELIRRMGGRLMDAGMFLPLFQEYADLLEGAELLLDKTMVVYKAEKGPPGIHPLPDLRPGQRPGRAGAGDGNAAYVRGNLCRPLRPVRGRASAVFHCGDPLPQSRRRSWMRRELEGGGLPACEGGAGTAF